MLLPIRPGLVRASKKPPTAASHAERGAAAYRQGRFEEAVAEFREAYSLDSAPAFLFNIAQSYRRMGKREDSVRYYQLYLDFAPGARNRKEVEKRIGEFAPASTRSEESSVDPADNLPVASVPGVAASDLREEQLAPALAAPIDNLTIQTGQEQAIASKSTTMPSGSVAGSEQTSSQRGGHGMTLAGFGCGAVGLASMGMGVFFAVEAKRYRSEAYDWHHPYDPGRDASADRATTLQWVAFSAGAIAFGTGAILYFFGRRPWSSSIALSPAALPQGGGAGLTGSF